ncbi:restriction endonuclease [Streptomyces sp. DT193]|uniref:restriction endonuclease n=1 Tax=Streptomyces sp. DT193 TaxID=3393418 RepID=UPI003CFA2FA6
MHTAFVSQPAMLWLTPIMLLVAATTGWVLAARRYGRRPVAPFQCKRACCSPSRVDGLDHREFEYLVRELMIRDGADKVKRVGGAGDNGADVVAVDPVGQRWIIQCKHRKQGLSGAAVGVQDFQILNGTGRPVHKGHVVVMVTNGKVTARARNFAREQNLQVIDRFLLEEWIDTNRPVWELLGITPRALSTSTVPAEMPVALEPSPADVGITSADQQEPLYTLAEAYEAGFVPWKPTTMRQYLVRSQRRGVPLPRGAWDGQGHHYTEEQWRTWLKNWRAQAGPNSKVHDLHPDE